VGAGLEELQRSRAQRLLQGRPRDRTPRVGQGGSLASITSKEEQEFVYSTIIDKTIALPRWIGLTDSANEGTFVWASGEAFSYANWGASQPDDFGGVEDCVELFQGDGTWNDDNCTYEYHSVCELTP
jgi:hypothetical protein